MFDGNSIESSRGVRDHMRLRNPVPEVNFQRGEQILRKVYVRVGQSKLGRACDPLHLLMTR